MNQSKKLNTTIAPKSIFILFVITLISVIFVASVYVLFFSPKAPLAVVDEKKELTEEEVIALGEKVASMYAAETVPTAAEGKDQFNHGLDETSTETPEGVIIFSGRKILEPSKYTQLFALDLSAPTTTEPEAYIPDYFTSAMAEFEDTSNPSDFYTLTVSEYSLANEKDGVSIHRYDSETGTVQPFSEATGTYERATAWSPTSELIAYSRLKADRESDIDLVPLDNWETVVFHPESNKLVATIGGALYPHWSPDGNKLVFLKTEGLFVYDLTTQEERAVVTLPEGGLAIASSMIDLSSDGKYLIWTSAKSGMITINEITSWDTVELSELGRMQVPNTEFYWPVFSPDGKYYAVQAIDTLQGNDFLRKNARIEIRPLLSRDVVYTRSLEDYIFDALFSDEWVVKTEEVEEAE